MSAALLSLHCALLDEKTLSAGGMMTELDSRTYLAWSNSLSRALLGLGLKGAPERPRSLSDIIKPRPAPAMAAE